MQAFIVQYSLQNSAIAFGVGFYNAGTLVEAKVLSVNNPNPLTDASLRSAMVTETLAYALTASYSLTASNIINLVNTPVIVAGDHINDAATDAPTNLNVLTTLLGTLTGEVNATNAKQNDLATKFNTLLDRLEAAGILLP